MLVAEQDLKTEAEKAVMEKEVEKEEVLEVEKEVENNAWRKCL